MMAAGKNISIGEFNRAVSLTQHTPLTSENFDSLGGCFSGEYGQTYCMEDRVGVSDCGSFMMSMCGVFFTHRIRDERGLMLIRNAFESRTNSGYMVVATDVDKNGEDEIYVRNGDKAVMYDLSWKGVEHFTASPYDEDVFWDGGCGGTDFGFESPFFTISAADGELRIGEYTKYGDFQTRFVASPTGVFGKNRSLFEKFFCDSDCVAKKIKNIIQCAADANDPLAQRQIQRRQLQSALKMVDDAAKKTK